MKSPNKAPRYSRSTVVTRQAYNTLGQMTHQWGSAAQPIQYVYDELGRLKEMRTYKDRTGWDAETLPVGFAGTDNYAFTKWDYHPGTDALWKKTDAANRAVEYLYDAAGLLTARKWARAVTGGERLTTSYSYQQTPNGLAVPGRVTGISYNDGTTPAVSMTYGRAYLSQVTDAGGQRFVSGTQYLGGGSENYVGDGWLKGLWVGRTVGHNGGSRTVLAKIGPQTIVQQTMAVLAEAGEAVVTDQMAVTGGSETHTYRRNAATGRLEILLRNTSTLARRWEYDPYGRLNRVDNGGMGVKYEHRADGKRSAMWQWKPTAAGAVSEVWPGWAFHYNDRGEVDGTSRFVPANQSDGAYNAPVVANQTRAYAYDNMGNRLAASQGPVDPIINPGHTTGYAPNALNQYDAITNVRHAEIRGQAVDGSKVTVRINGEEAVTIREEGQPSPPQNQTGDPNSFRYEAPVTTTDASWLEVEITATKNGLSQNKRGFTYVPPASEAPLYDEDGNQTSDGRWLYFWDAENRMTGAEEKPRAVGGVNDPALPLRKKLTFAYDYRHRRIMKQVHEWEGDAATGGFTKLVKDLRFVYDDWNLIAELDHTTASANSLHGSTVVRSYVWGLDLAGQSGADFQSISNPWQGAGGVGGLLSVKYQGVTYRPCYDGNGNIIGLQAGDGPQAGQIVARYDYDPFGNRITDTGPGVELCPFGFSTKYRDEETGMLYYGYRYYSPETGRWLNRDPLGEEGGINLYGVVGNDPVNFVDADGLAKTGGTNFPSPTAVPTRLTLSFDVVTPPGVRTCGLAAWVIRWKLSGKTTGGGTISQNVTMKANVTNCDGTNVTYLKYGGKYKGNGFSWSELWTVPANSNSADPPDIFRTVDFGLCTKGTMSIESDATFHEQLKNIPPSFRPFNPIEAGILPSRPGSATFPEASNNVHRKFEVDWNCCNKDKLGNYIKETTTIRPE